MTGSAFENKNTDPTDLADLDNLTLLFEGGTGDVDPFEVAGEDVGPVLAGWTNNFALGMLQLGGVNVGQIQLVDDFDNRPDWEGSEALYVSELVFNFGAFIDLNGLNLYYLNGGDPKQFFYGDTDLNGDVDLADLGNLAGNYGTTTGAVWADGDFDGDGDVDIVDLGALAGNYGHGVGPLNFDADAVSLGLVPEPASLCLLSMGGLVFLRRKQR